MKPRGTGHSCLDAPRYSHLDGCNAAGASRSVPPAHVLRCFKHQGCDHLNQPLFSRTSQCLLTSSTNFLAYYLLAQPSLRDLQSVLLLASPSYSKTLLREESISQQIYHEVGSKFDLHSDCLALTAIWSKTILVVKVRMQYTHTSISKKRM
ncbi:hypothetical protein GGR58DRAFT_119265 [Xylaria digitata]|nr:hypothetical protein GGR58DRAFT_119265 [Xylaria digitata]